jgi:hypothetical protein
MNTDTIRTKKCTECGKEFPRTKEYFSPIISPHGTVWFAGCCKECARVRIKRYRLKAKLVRLVDVKKSYSKETDSGILQQAFSVESLCGNNKCIRCNNPLEERDMKYEPDLGGEILGSYIYLHCWMCGQDYYRLDKEGVCECVGSGT